MCISTEVSEPNKEDARGTTGGGHVETSVYTS